MTTLVHDTFESGSVPGGFWSTSNGSVESGSIITGVYSYRVNAGGEGLDKNGGLGGAFYQVKANLLVDSGTTPGDWNKVKAIFTQQASHYVSVWLSYSTTTCRLGCNATSSTNKATIDINFDQVYAIELIINGTDSTYEFLVDGVSIDSGVAPYATVDRFIIGEAGFDSTAFDRYFDDVRIYSDLAVTPNVAPVAVAGYDPTVTVDWNILPCAGTVFAQGYDPIVSVNTNVLPGAGSVIVQGFNPTVAVTPVAPVAGGVGGEVGRGVGGRGIRKVMSKRSVRIEDEA